VSARARTPDSQQACLCLPASSPNSTQIAIDVLNMAARGHSHIHFHSQQAAIATQPLNHAGWLPGNQVTHRVSRVLAPDLRTPGPDAWHLAPGTWSPTIGDRVSGARRPALGPGDRCRNAPPGPGARDTACLVFRQLLLGATMLLLTLNPKP
jgi:hypothetical protein